MGKMSRILLLAVLTATLVTNLEAQDVGVKDFTITAPADITTACTNGATYTFDIEVCEIDGTDATVTAVNVYYTDSADFNDDATQKSDPVTATLSGTFSVTADSAATTSSGAEAVFAADSGCTYTHICVVTTTTGDTYTKNDFMCIQFSDSAKSSAHCPPASCNDPGNVENGQKTGDTYTHKSEVTYSCNEDYHLVGEATLECYNGDWDNDKPTCSDTPVTTVQATTDSGTKSATTESGVVGLVQGMYSILVALALSSALVDL